MNKIFLLIVYVIVFMNTTNIHGQQVKVNSMGYLGILSPGAPISPLAINCNGATTQKFAVNGETVGIYSLRTGATSSSWLYGIMGANIAGASNWNIGVNGSSFGNSSGGRSFGVLGSSGNTSDGYNYGVFGTLSGSQNGAGIVGTVSYNLDVYVPGIYAGYFEGDVCASGDVSAMSFTTTSDARLKKNVLKIDKAKALTGILSLEPVEYNLIPRMHTSKGDSTKVNKANNKENSISYKRKNFGLIAQELKLIYPDLVSEDSEGYLSINYTGLIPLLIQSVKELKEEINTKSISAGSSTSNEAIISTTPTINYSINKSVSTAYASLFDMQGKLIKTVMIENRGNGSLTFDGTVITKGMYLYSIIADGKEVETKRLIVAI